MKLLRMKLANWLTQGGYLAACKAATHWEEQYRLMQDKAVKLEQNLLASHKNANGAFDMIIECNERINKLSDDNHRMSEGLDQIIRYGEGKIGPTGNGSLRRAVRMAEAALYPAGVPQEMANARAQGEMSL